MSHASNFLTIGQAAQLLGCQSWMIARLFETGALPPPEYIGRARVVARRDLPKVRAALKKRGWPKPVPE